MIYLLHLLFGWVSRYPVSCLVLDTVLVTLIMVAIALFLLARYEGLRWRLKDE